VSRVKRAKILKAAFVDLTTPQRAVLDENIGRVADTANA
jgi:hypothetical protein